MSGNSDKSLPEKLYSGGITEYDKKEVIIGNVVIILWLLAGIYAVFLFSPPAGVIYGVFIAVMILFVMRWGLCTRCFYYGRRCSMGWGLYTAKLFKKKDTDSFENCAAGKFAPVFWMTASFLPVILLLVSAYLSYSHIKAALLIFLVLILIAPGNKKSREKACSQCKMRYICHGSAAKDESD